MDRRGIFWVVLLLVLAATPAARPMEVVTPGYVAQPWVSYVTGFNDWPRGMACDNAGNVYLTHPGSPDAREGYIYRVGTDKSHGRWVEDMVRPSGIVWAGGTDYGDYFYVCDGSEESYGPFHFGEVMKIGLDGSKVPFCSPNSRPKAIGLDRTGAYGGYLYCGTSGEGDHIDRLLTDGTAVHFSDYPGNISGGPLRIEFDPSGMYPDGMYVLSETTAPVYGTELAGIDTDGNATVFSEAFYGVGMPRFDEAGLFGGGLFMIGRVSSQERSAIWRVNTAGEPVEKIIQSSGSADQWLMDFAFAPDGSMYVMEHVQDTDTVILTRVVPEPGICLLLAGGAMGLWRRRKR